MAFVSLTDYEPIVGKQCIEELYLLAEGLKGKRIKMVNSTAVGGGVAEILNRIIPLLNDLGITTLWTVDNVQDIVDRNNGHDIVDTQL